MFAKKHLLFFVSIRYESRLPSYVGKVDDNTYNIIMFQSAMSRVYLPTAVLIEDFFGAAFRFNPL